MSVILIMLPAALVLAGLGVWAFIVAAKRGQFDDLDTPPIRAVFDDDDYPDPDRAANESPTNAKDGHDAHTRDQGER